jgi:hypothetical protein
MEDGEEIVVRTKKELTNEENTLTVSIDPFRLKVFGLDKRLSKQGVKDLVQLASEHATIQVQKYFDESIYYFDVVEFEVLDLSHKKKVQDVSLDRNLLRVVVAKDETKPLELLERRQGQQQQQQRRNQNQETKFTASIVFGGNATFFRLPAATSEETNEAISEAMGQTWKLKQAFKSSDNDELQSINSISILDTAAPTSEPTKSPTSEPTLSPTPPPPSSVTKSPTLVPIILQTEAPS